MGTTERKSIYLADDDHFFVELTKQVFKKSSSSLNIVSFNNGLDLLSSLSQEKTAPSLIVLDLNMPSFSGIETLKALKNGENHQIPVIILSSTDNQSQVNDCYLNNASIFIPKPKDENTLNEVVETISLIVKYLDPVN